MINKEKTIQLYQSILAGNKQRVFEHWHASSIATCPRAHFYMRKGVPRLTTVTAPKVIRWGAGHHLETAIREHVENVWGKTESNIRFTSEAMDLTGEFDNRVIEGDRLVEIKSVHDMAFIERNGECTLKEQIGTKTLSTGREQAIYEPKTTPYLAHEYQNHAYVLLLAEQGIEIKGIDYVYIALGGRMCVYSTEVQEKILEAVKRRIDTLKTALKENTPPLCICNDPSHPLYDSSLRWCDYRNEETGECCGLKLYKEMK